MKTSQINRNEVALVLEQFIDVLYHICVHFFLVLRVLKSLRTTLMSKVSTDKSDENRTAEWEYEAERGREKWRQRWRERNRTASMNLSTLNIINFCIENNHIKNYTKFQLIGLISNQFSLYGRTILVLFVFSVPIKSSFANHLYPFSMEVFKFI